MAVLPIITLPDPVLKQKAKRVKTIDGSIQKLIENMLETVRADPGRAALAAPQVGHPVAGNRHRYPRRRKHRPD